MSYGSDWAMTVVSPGWARVCAVFEKLMRASGYRLFNRPRLYAWNRAIGPNPTQRA